MNFARATQAAGGSVLQVTSAPTKPPVCVATSASLALYTWADLRGRSLRVVCAFKSCTRVQLPMPIQSSKQEVHPGVLKSSKNGLVLTPRPTTVLRETNIDLSRILLKRGNRRDGGWCVQWTVTRLPVSST